MEAEGGEEEDRRGTKGRDQQDKGARQSLGCSNCHANAVNSIPKQQAK